jgi:hypothetical protein
MPQKVENGEPKGIGLIIMILGCMVKSGMGDGADIWVSVNMG